jgi:hypothetical protein
MAFLEEIDFFFLKQMGTKLRSTPVDGVNDRARSYHGVGVLDQLILSNVLFPLRFSQQIAEEILRQEEEHRNENETTESIPACG